MTRLRAAFAAALASLILAAPASAEPPNIVFILTDDQPYGESVDKMPWLSDAGFTEFDTMHTNNPLCCPSRATILSGLYSHHTGVEDNTTGHLLDDTQTIATWLDDADYETAYYGKYLNGYPFGMGGEYQPAGWDTFRAFKKGVYEDPEIRGNDGRFHESEGYSTDIIAKKATNFVRKAEEPFFTIVAPWGPHSPYTPANRHRHLFDDEPVDLPFFNERSTAAPEFWRQRKELGRVRVKKVVRAQWETLRSVDEGVERISDKVEDRGIEDNTVFIYMSDNGYSLGAHRWLTKGCPYDGCTHIPFMVKAPGTTDLEVTSLVSNVDVAPTIVDLADADAPPLDGRSLVPYLNGFEEERGILLRHVGDGRGGSDQSPGLVPNFWGIRTDSWKYIEYEESGEVELYDLEADPAELRNLARKAEFDEIEAELRDQMIALRDG